MANDNEIRKNENKSKRKLIIGFFSGIHFLASKVGAFGGDLPLSTV